MFLPQPICLSATNAPRNLWELYGTSGPSTESLKTDPYRLGEWRRGVHPYAANLLHLLLLAQEM